MTETEHGDDPVDRRPDIDELSRRMLEHFLGVADRARAGQLAEKAGEFTDQTVSAMVERLWRERLEEALSRDVAAWRQSIQKLSQHQAAGIDQKLNELQQILDERVHSAIRQATDDLAREIRNTAGRARGQGPAFSAPEADDKTTRVGFLNNKDRVVTLTLCASVVLLLITLTGLVVGALIFPPKPEVTAVAPIPKPKPQPQTLTKKTPQSQVVGNTPVGQESPEPHKKTDTSEAAVLPTPPQEAALPCDIYNPEANAECRSKLVKIGRTALASKEIFPIPDSNGPEFGTYAEALCDADTIKLFQVGGDQDWRSSCKQTANSSLARIMANDRVTVMQAVAKALEDLLEADAQEYLEAQVKGGRPGSCKFTDLKKGEKSIKVDGEIGYQTRGFLNSIFLCLPSFDGDTVVATWIDDTTKEDFFLAKNNSPLVNPVDGLLYEVLVFYGYLHELHQASVATDPGTAR